MRNVNSADCSVAVTTGLSRIGKNLFQLVLPSSHWQMLARSLGTREEGQRLTVRRTVNSVPSWLCDMS